VHALHILRRNSKYYSQRIIQNKYYGPKGRSCCVGRVEPLRSLLPVRYGKVEEMKNVLVPTLFLQVRESSRCPYCRLRYGST
jgi:hypothetical protein